MFSTSDLSLRSSMCPIFRLGYGLGFEGPGLGLGLGPESCIDNF